MYNDFFYRQYSFSTCNTDLEPMHGLENELSRMDRKIFSQKVVNNKQKRRTLNAKISLVPQIIYISELLRLSS